MEPESRRDIQLWVSMVNVVKPSKKRRAMVGRAEIDRHEEPAAERAAEQAAEEGPSALEVRHPPADRQPQDRAEKRLVFAEANKKPGPDPGRPDILANLGRRRLDVVRLVIRDLNEWFAF